MMDRCLGMHSLVYCLVHQLVQTMVPMMVHCLAQTLLALCSVHRCLLHLSVRMCSEQQLGDLLVQLTVPMLALVLVILFVGQSSSVSRVALDCHQKGEVAAEAR